jgi:hypothetical protein
VNLRPGFGVQSHIPSYFKSEEMLLSSQTIKFGVAGALASLMVASATPAAAAMPVAKPVPGEQVRFPKGTWAALPQVGPDGKVRQCVMVAPRDRATKDGLVTTRFAINISRGAGLVITIGDDNLPREYVLDDQAEILINGKSFPAVSFPIGNTFIFHPGDAAGAMAALGKATEIRLRSDGAGVDSYPIWINLPAEALNWLKQCGQAFDIPIDKISDPNAPDLPAPRVRSPKIAVLPATPAGPPGITDKQKIDGWDASELRNGDGTIAACMIRQHYVMGSEPDARKLATFFLVSRKNGLTMMLKDSSRNGQEGQPVEATLKFGDQPFPAFKAEVWGPDEVGIKPEHANALAALLESGGRATFKASTGDQLEFPVNGSTVGWLRACARRNGMALEPAAQ